MEKTHDELIETIIDLKEQIEALEDYSHQLEQRIAIQQEAIREASMTLREIIQ